MDYLPLIAIGISGSGLILSYINQKRSQERWEIEQVRTQAERDNKMNERIARTEKDSEVFWKILEPHMAAIIHSPNHRERDELVDKLVAGTLVECEMKRTAELLEENIRENKDEGKRLASALLLARVKGLIEKTELDKKAKIIEEERKRSEAEETWRKNTRDKQLSRHH